MTTKQHWEVIPEFPEYEITPSGVPRRIGKSKALRVTHVNGRPKFTPSQGGKVKTVYVAHAVWSAYVGSLNGGKLVYRDGNPGNPRLENLILCDNRHLIRQLMQPDGLRKRVEIDLYASYGRRKPSTVCRRGHPLSMTGEPDGNTGIWGWGERTCLACQRGERRRVYPYDCPDYL